ncbi:hypothetical protein L7F22_049227 [Adiantum nelumboides]|nr:hypothetical protein [Adiantum nelumboides]
MTLMHSEMAIAAAVFRLPLPEYGVAPLLHRQAATVRRHNHIANAVRISTTTSSTSGSISTSAQPVGGAAPPLPLPLAARQYGVLLCPEEQQLLPQHFNPDAPVVSSTTITELLRLPLPGPLRCSFSIRLHPDYHDSIVGHCNEWGLSLFDHPAGSPLPDAVREAFLGGLLSLLPSLAFPSGRVSARRLLLSAKLTLWYFLLDDSIDEADPQTATEIGKGYVTVLLSPRLAASMKYSTSNTRIVKFLERFRVEVWDEIRREMSPDLERRYVRECILSITAMKEMHDLMKSSMAADRECGNVQEKVKAMLERRLLDGFCWTFTTLLEYALGIELPDPEGKTEMGRMVQKMIRVAGKQSLFVNELLSFGKEYARTDVRSVGGAMLGHHRPAGPVEDGGWADGGSAVEAMQDAIGEIWRIIQEEERNAAALLCQIRTLASPQGGSADSISVLYAEALCHFISGHFYWASLTWRYHGPHPVAWNTSPAYVRIHRIPPLNVLF